MTITVVVPESGGYGVPLTLTGTINPATNLGRVGLSTTPNTPPTQWYPVDGAEWTLTITPEISPIYVWAEDFTTSGQIGGNLASLRWSDTRGSSWQNPLTQSLGRTGEFYTSVQWRRLGIARDRVFELSWTMDALTGLNGAFIDFDQSLS